MNNLEIFKNEEFGEIRTIELDNEIYFVGSDVARALGYKNTKDALLNHVDEYDKKIVLRSEITTLENHIPKKVLPVNFVSADIPNRGLTIINESGLYALVFASKLPNAKKFKHWVTSEVLPSIRKHGKYEMPKNPFETLKLMFDVVENHEQKIDNMSKDIIDIKENAPLNPGEYNYIGGLVTSKVRKIVEEELGLKYHENRDVKKELFKSINGEIKKITGIDTRSQLKQKDFKMVKDFVQNWEPSKATLIVIQQLNLN